MDNLVIWHIGALVVDNLSFVLGFGVATVFFGALYMVQIKLEKRHK